MCKAGCPIHPPVARAQRPSVALVCTAAVIAAATVAWPTPALSQAEIVPIALSQYEHSSNEATATGATYSGDLLRFAAGFESDYLFRRQELFLDAAYGKVSYGELGDFSDDEYALRTGMNWLFGRYLDGILEATDDKTVPSTPDRLVTGNSIAQERRLTGTLNVELAERWRLETGAISRSLDTPIVEIADFGLRETIHRFALLYLTDARLSYGAEYEDIDGKFRNAPELAAYTQRTPSALLQYTVPDLNTVKVKLGTTERKQSNEPGPFRENTGDISIERILTGKTAVNLQGSRNIENYFGPDAGAFALISSWNAGVNWKATGKSTLYVDYGQTLTDFLGDGVAGQIVAGRKDRSSTINVGLKSETLPWLTTELYLRFDDVNSNIDIYSFDGTLVGLKLKARLPE